MREQAADFQWMAELEKTVVSSLATSFGLDFLLFEDKLGGNVDTIHNVRQGVWATKEAKDNYVNRGGYDSTAYHSDKNFKNKGMEDKAKLLEGKLHDSYRGKKMKRSEVHKRDLDHVISGKEIHDDPGRVLAGAKGEELANQSSNLQSTHRSINRSKNAKPIKQWVDELPQRIDLCEQKIQQDKERLSSMPRDTQESKHKARELEASIRSQEEKLEEFKSVDVEGMLKRDAEARAHYEREINLKYYMGSEFIKNSGLDAATAGLKMGLRQVVGLVLAEIWFEFKERAPDILKKHKINFSFRMFVDDISNTFIGIWQRVKKRFSDFLKDFNDGVLAGALSSATTTLFNIFFTTQTLVIKLIRESWSYIVKALKLLIFNPDKLSLGELCKAIIGISNLAVSTVLGVYVYSALTPLLSFPLGAELASFLSALTTGVLTVSLNYFILFSPIAQKIWKWVDSAEPYQGELKQFQEINKELDRYLIELSSLEFNFDIDELHSFKTALTSVNSEIEKSIILQAEIERRNIDLPFQIGDSESTKGWLKNLGKEQ